MSPVSERKEVYIDTEKKTAKVRLVLLVFTMIVYGFGFKTVHMSVGNGAFIFMNIFPVTAGLLFGMGGGFIFGFLTIVYIVFLGSTVHLDFKTFMPTIAVSSIVMLILGSGVGRMRDLSLAVKQELYKRRESEKALRESKNELELRVTERTLELKQTTIELKESETIHKELFDNSPIPLYIQDFSETEEYIKNLKREIGINNIKFHLQNNKDEVFRLVETAKIIKANKAALDMYKVDSADKLFQSMTPAINSDDMQHFINQVVDFTDGKDYFEGGARNIDQHGNILDILLRKAVINRKKNGLSKIIVSVTDVTDLHQSHREKVKLESFLHQAQKMEAIGTLAGGIAHDFNNILFPIVGHTEMLLEDVSEDSPFRDSLMEIHTSSLRARDLVQQILAFSRQEKNELKLLMMQPIIKEAMKLIRSTIPTTIVINQNLQSDCGPVKADPTLIHQIVMNLATNAYHTMEKNGGELKVTLKETELGQYDLITPGMPPGLYACLTVSDTGMGMNKDVMNRIFEPFFTTKGTGKGTGMGLSVVHGIVKRMNGEIQVYSEPDKGSEFLVYLPIVENAFENHESLIKESILGGHERILLVDDEEAIIAMEKQALERLGYYVISRMGSTEALEAFRADPDKFDLIITDMAMPNMSGDKLAVELIKIRPGIPILLCTGYSESMTDEKIKSLGIKGFLTKPIVIKDLAKKLREILDHSDKNIPE